MEHLPQPSRPYKGITCRYVPNTYGSAPQATYDFFKFGQLSGFKFYKLLKGKYEDELTPEHLEGLFQAWLYFSLLKEIFGQDTVIQDFTRRDPDDGYVYLSTLNFHQSIRDWHEHYSKTPEADKEGLKSHVISAIRAAVYILNRIAGSPHASPTLTPLISPEFEVIVRTLIQSLELGLFADSLPRQRVIDENGLHICQMLIQTLLECKWCPNQINMLAHSLDVPSLYYATLLGPDFSGKDHSTCTDKTCKANQVDEVNYQKAHVSSECHCNSAGPSSDDLAKIVRDGCIPLIEVTPENEDDQLHIRVCKYEEGMKFVAISHVWADGLGNPDANTLPHCQLRRISEHVEAILPKARFFWCDTLCVPTVPRDLRKKAIQRMRDVYQQAYIVLVMDVSLRSASVSNSAEELMMRVTCSTWIRRLWTYQETVLARRLRVVVGDGIGNLDQAFKDLTTRQVGQPTTSGSFNTYVGPVASAFFRNVISTGDRSIEKSEPRSGVDIGSLWDNIQWRMTSRASDESICLATALGLDLATILDTSEDARMQEVFKQVNGWPPYMIFALYDRMSESGWKWAPLTLLHPSGLATSKMHHIVDSTSWHEEGLVVRFPGFLIDIDHFRDQLKRDDSKQSPVVDLNRTFYIKDRETGNWYSCFRNDDQQITNFDLSEIRIQGLRKPAVILSCPIEALSPDTTAAAQLWDGLLVDMKRDHDDDIIFTEYVVRVLVGLLPPNMNAGIEEAFADQELAEDYAAPLMTFALCEVRDPQQRWCVG